MPSAQGTQQQKPEPRKPAYQDWPTLKVLTVPKGKFSRETDEWCLTYCTQNVTGRFHGAQPSCRSLCIRKVFPHEVRNIISYKRHDNVGSDGKTRYPLPAEGQSENIPRLLGGKPPTRPDDEEQDEDEMPLQSRSTAPANEPTKYWDEGWYLWTSSNPNAAVQKIATMSHDLAMQQRFEKVKEKRKRVWEEYVEYMERRSSSKFVDAKDKENQFYGDIEPRRPVPDSLQGSLLVPFPPDFTIMERIRRLLEPSRHALSLLDASITSGEMRRFGQRAWEKAWSKEPWILASRAFSQTWDVIRGKEAGDDDDDNKRRPR